MLDETTCPVCGKELDETDWLDDPGPTYAEMTRTNGVWAVAHYLAHLVQQKQVIADHVEAVDDPEVLMQRIYEKNRRLYRSQL